MLTESEVAEIKKRESVGDWQTGVSAICKSHEELRKQVRDLWRMLRKQSSDAVLKDIAKNDCIPAEREFAAKVLAALEKEPQ